MVVKVVGSIWNFKKIQTDFQIYISLLTVIITIFLPQFVLHDLIYTIAFVESITTPIIIEVVYIVCNVEKIYTMDGRKIAEVLKLYLK